MKSKIIDNTGVHVLLEWVAALHNLKAYELLKRTKERRYVEARFMMFYIMQKYGWTVAEIAEFFGLQRCAVYSGLRSMRVYIDFYDHYRQQFDYLNNKLLNRINNAIQTN